MAPTAPGTELLHLGKAGSDTAADHISVLDAGLARLSAGLRARDGHGRVAVLVAPTPPALL